MNRAIIEEVSAAIEGTRWVKNVILLTQNYASIDMINSMTIGSVRASFFHYHYVALFNAFLRSVASSRYRMREYIRSLYPFSNKVYEKRYTCLLNKARSHRIVLFGWLARRGLLDKGAVSFHGGDQFHDKKRLGDEFELASKQFRSFTDDIQECERLMTAMPFRNFKEGNGENFTISFTVPAYRAAPLSLVSESEMSWGRRSRFTEKTVKSILAGHAVIVAGNPGTLAALRRMGFATYAPWVEEKYDNIASPEDRLRAALLEFERYMLMPESEYMDFIKDTWFARGENLRSFLDLSESEIRSWFNSVAIFVDE